jgi:hypothetical protein
MVHDTTQLTPAQCLLRPGKEDHGKSEMLSLGLGKERREVVA